MKKTKHILVNVIIVAVLVITILGFSYSYFTANLSGSETSTTLSISGGQITIAFSGGSNIVVENIYPQSTEVASKMFTVTGSNTTTVTVSYELSLIIDNYTFTSNAIKYTLDSVNTGSNGTIVPAINTQTSIPGTISIKLGSGSFVNGTDKIHTYVLKLYFPETGTNQNTEQGKNISAHIEIESGKVSVPTGWDTAASGTLLKAIKDTNTVGTPLTVPGQQISTESEAIFAGTDDDYGTSYYFRGAVENNYVVFANMCWRIVRVTGDGSIKIVLYNYNPNEVDNPCLVSQDGTSNAFARYTGETFTTAFNTSYNRNAYIGFMYGTPGSATYVAEHANTNKSTILTNLETWYTSKLSSYSSHFADTIWCNDKEIDTEYPYGTSLGYGTNQTGYSARGRLYAYANNLNFNPNLVCLNDSADGKLSKFTADETTYGNGVLTYKIGLLTADEIAYAGGIYGINNVSYYLYKNSTADWWWSLSPFAFVGGASTVLAVKPDTNISNGMVNGPCGLRPAISLISSTQVTGTGTSTNPFVVS